jgi:hypothetical protein
MPNLMRERLAIGEAKSTIVAPCRATAAPLENLAKIAKPNTIETMKGPAESGKIVRWKSKKNSEENSEK